MRFSLRKKLVLDVNFKVNLKVTKILSFDFVHLLYLSSFPYNSVWRNHGRVQYFCDIRYPVIIQELSTSRKKRKNNIEINDV